MSKPIDRPDAAAELNLIGKTTAEAEYELDRFIDEAYMASLPRVRIIHGFGTGALKNYVHHFLKITTSSNASPSPLTTRAATALQLRS
jgi:dsDNA-specific endonuclease/ATPase MutS2